MRDALVVSSEVLVAKPKRFVREVLRLPDGQEVDWYYVDTTPSVMVVPVTEAGTVVLVRQYRHNLRRDTLELPAGVVEPDEPIAEAAHREMVEETGHGLVDPSTLMALGPFDTLPSETNKAIHFFLAAPVVRLGAAGGDNEMERYFDMGTVELPLAEAVGAIGGSIRSLETAAALLLARAHL